MPPTDTSRDLGRHEAQIEQLQQDMNLVKADVHEIRLMLAEATGGWKVIVLIGTIAGAFGALLARYIPGFH